jgi:aminomethyltransferase
MVDFAGWQMPQQYSSVKDEHEAVRKTAGVFDVSHMGRFDVRGTRGGDFLQSVVTNDVSKLAPGHAQYNLLCRPDGGILDDLVVYHGAAGWSVVVNAATREKDLAWLRDRAARDVDVVDRSDEVGLLALQGPRAAELLPVAGLDLDALPYFGLAEASIAGVPGVLSRTGYTGEDGFELFVPAQRVGHVWDALLEAGVAPCGLAARDVCRLEAGLRLYGTDMDEESNPYEVGLGWTVRLNKGEFVGRDALERAKAQGPSRVLIGLSGLDRTIPRHGSTVDRDGRPVGVVTSGTYSFWLQKGIGMASVETPAAPPGSQLAVESRAGQGRAEVVALPFYRGSIRQVART